MRNSPLLLGALVALACSACGGTAAPSDPIPSSQSPSGGAAGAAGDGTGASGDGTAAGGAGAAAGGGANAPGAGQNPGQPAAGTTPISGSFGGSYHVPTTAVLDAAATFDVTEFTWTVSGGNVATLAYNLPRALVGKLVRVVFTGPFDPATGKATLTGIPGTSVCTVTTVDVSCSEAMAGLMPVNPDLAVVTKLATTYPGPAADRTTIAQQFAGDPIGIAHLDFSRPGVPEPIEIDTGGHRGKP